MLINRIVCKIRFIKIPRARWAKAGKLKPIEPCPESEPEEPQAKAQDEAVMPFSMFRGELPLGPLKVECHVLNDGKRVFTQREIVRVLTAGTEEGNLPKYTKGNPLINNDIVLGQIIQFKVPGTQFMAHGREATVLVEICTKYLEARDRDLLSKAQLQPGMCFWCTAEECAL